MDKMKKMMHAHGHGTDTDTENVKTGRAKSSTFLSMTDDMALRLTMYQQIFFVLDQVQAASVRPAHAQPSPCAHAFEQAC